MVQIDHLLMYHDEVDRNWLKLIDPLVCKDFFIPLKKSIQFNTIKCYLSPSQRHGLKEENQAPKQQQAEEENGDRICLIFDRVKDKH
ncbi:hypothetical protein TrispH2_009010 [Trichoplax sp. H2]|nr:hypothetical protein TrispH2_009010 [Trichoplax sp. H2]|eukprot:RDD39202.1 hypothetical protein TrispH2_009010 [Trichoplax sp. H2]